MTIAGDQLLSREVARDERLLWSGTPAQGIQFRKTDLLLMPLNLLGIGLAFFIVVTSGAKAPSSWLVPAIAFGASGFYMLVGRFFADAWLRKQTTYGVTDRRVLIVSGFLSRQIKSLPLATMNDITLNEQEGGGGSIQFGPGMPGGWMFAGTPWPGASKRMPPMFELISDVRHVHEVVIKAQQALTIPAAVS